MVHWPIGAQGKRQAGRLQALSLARAPTNFFQGPRQLLVKSPSPPSLTHTYWPTIDEEVIQRSKAQQFAVLTSSLHHLNLIIGGPSTTPTAPYPFPRPLSVFGSTRPTRKR
ncbi:hypothetical protein VDGL01_07630 [Verticillium dahliae]